MTILDDLTGGPEHRPARAEADKAELSAMIRAREGRRLAGPVPRRLGSLGARGVVAGLVVAGALAGGGVAAAVLLSPQRPTVLDEARCYSEPSTDFSTSFPGTSVSVAGPAGATGTTVDVPDQAVGACAAVWRQGLLVYGAPGVVQGDGVPDHPVPALTACVLPSGEAAVFPGGPKTCRSLGLPPMAHLPKSRSHREL